MSVFTEEKTYDDGEIFQQIELPNHYVDYIQRDSDTLFVTFDGMKPKAPKGELWQKEPWAGRFIKGLGFDHIGIKLKKLDWYRCPELHKLWQNEEFLMLFKKYKKVMFYGLSMGGFAALVFSSAVPSSHVLAIAPQSTMDPDKVGWDKRFERTQEQDWSGGFSDAACLIGVQEKIYVLYDSFFPEEKRHIERLPKRGITALRAPTLGHDMDRFLVKYGLLKDMVVHALAEDLETWFPKAIRVRREDDKCLARLYASMALRAGQREKFKHSIEYAKKALELDIQNRMALSVAKRLQELLG